jgi:hypothetical protein
VTCVARFPNGVRCKSAPEFGVSGKSGDESFVCRFHRFTWADAAFRRKQTFAARLLNREELAALEDLEAQA